jgi:predicted DNA-binding WGR domain protein
MSQLDFRLYVERRDPSRNMARFYALSLEPTLFGLALSCRYGRIGTRGREMIEHFPSEKEALVRFLALLSTKRRRGYKMPTLGG